MKIVVGEVKLNLIDTTGFFLIYLMCTYCGNPIRNWVKTMEDVVGCSLGFGMVCVVLLSDVTIDWLGLKSDEEEEERERVELSLDCRLDGDVRDNQRSRIKDEETNQRETRSTQFVRNRESWVRNPSILSCPYPYPQNTLKSRVLIVNGFNLWI